MMWISAAEAFGVFFLDGGIARDRKLHLVLEQANPARSTQEVGLSAQSGVRAVECSAGGAEHIYLPRRVGLHWQVVHKHGFT